ncbi:alpha/beta fold hydrolase [Flavobacteriaceae bacterium Ap0902]|nr:alpha/beta fold hydrolase [Flavobacteriaceae bacterium Ap0902]
MKNLFNTLLICLAVMVTAQQKSQDYPSSKYPVDQDIFSKYKSQFIEIDGYKINVEILGEGDPIVFLPGGPGNSHDYMQGAFGQYYKTNKLVFFDFLGRGKSDDAKDVSEYAVKSDTDLIEKLRKKLKLGKISVVGHSYGTVPAQDYAIRYGEHLDKMFLIAGFHSGHMWQANCDSYNHYSKTHFPEIWAKVDSIRSLGYVSSDPAHQKIYGSLPTKYIYYHNTKTRGNVPKEKFRGWANDVYVQIIGRDGDFEVSGSMMDTDFRRKLKDIKAKTMITAGRYDGVSTPEFNEQYKTFMPQAKFIMFEESGHNPYLEEPEKFYAVFEEFFGIK